MTTGAVVLIFVKTKPSDSLLILTFHLKMVRGLQGSAMCDTLCMAFAFLLTECHMGRDVLDASYV